MSHQFVIKNPENSQIRIDAQTRMGSGKFVVTNQFPDEIRASARVQPVSGCELSWFEVKDQHRGFGPAQFATFEVAVQVPADAAPDQSCSFRLDVATARNPDDERWSGEPVGFRTPPAQEVEPPWWKGLWWVPLAALATVILGMALWSAFRGSEPTQALRFDGSRSYVSVPGIPDLNQLTVEARVRVRRFGQKNYHGIVVSKHGDSSGWELRVGSGVPTMLVTAGKVHYEVRVPAAEVPTTPGLPLKTGVWFHLAGTYDGTTAKLYLDGKLLAQQAVSGGVNPQFSGDMTIGRNSHLGWTDRWMDGDVTEVRVWNHARSADSIAANKDGKLPDRTSGLEGWWPMPLADPLTELIDHSGYSRHGQLHHTSWVPLEPAE